MTHPLQDPWFQVLGSSLMPDGHILKGAFINQQGTKVDYGFDHIMPEQTTQFFRFLTFYEKLLRHLHKQRTDDAPIRILIAGGSMGCEAYSGAILARSLFGPDHPFIFDTLDACEAVTKIAEKAQYHYLMFQGMRPDLISHFHAVSGATSRLEVNPDIRSHVNVLPPQKVEAFKTEAPYDAVVSFNVLMHIWNIVAKDGRRFINALRIGDNFTNAVGRLSKNIVCLDASEEKTESMQVVASRLFSLGYRSLLDRNWQPAPINFTNKQSYHPNVDNGTSPNPYNGFVFTRQAPTPSA